MRNTYTIEKCALGHRIRFSAMASPCEVIVEVDSHSSVDQLAKLITDETWRIENKYSRYQTESICTKINNSHNNPISIDTETYELLKFSEQCYQISNGLFDITSGVLRKVWRFDGSNIIPSSPQVEAILPLVGWTKIEYNEQHIMLPKGMEIDFGGIGKEYAVDKICQLITQNTLCSALVNFGGDLAVTAPRKDNKPWSVGIDLTGISSNKSVNISFERGAIATSGDASRYLEKDGKRYSHILNPKTGWPIEHAPSSITVASTSCLNAGIISTIAMLQGENAEQFLDENDFKHWTFRT